MAHAGTTNGFLIRWIVTALAVGIAIALVPGLSFSTGSEHLFLNIVAVSLFLALINASIKPLLQTLSLPITFLTLGIFALVVNTAMLYLAAWLAGTLFGVTLVISSFGSAFIASIIISIATSIISGLIG